MMFNHRERGLMPRALLWLIGLGSFFFISYGFANWVTSLRSDVGVIVFSWERSIPLWPWTIVPYWSIDFLYGLAVLLATTKRELDTLGRRLLTAQIICITCFLLYPLHFTFDRPVLDGFFGTLFDILMGFDKPFNQAPSLHITLLVILWVFYSQHISTKWRWLLHLWFSLIGISVLTTWQHHFFDVPTGVIVGCLCIWLWPEQRCSPLVTRGKKELLWASIYYIAALVSLVIALAIGGVGYWLLWLTVSFILVALNYSVIGVEGFQKKSNGRYDIAVWILYAPYIAIMWFNSRLWTRNNNPADLIVENIYLGRIPNNSALKHYQFIAIVDLCAEIPITKHYYGQYFSIPVLDMTAPSIAVCEQAVTAIEQSNKQGKVLVCCALGYSRSATVVIAWLLWVKKATTVDEAIAIVCKARPDIVIHDKQRIVLQQWLVKIQDNE